VHDYELMYILHPRLTSEEALGAIEQVGARVTARGGEVKSVDNWGRRRLAYPIDGHFEGTYVLATLALPPEGTAPLEADLRISEGVIRHLLIRGIIPYQGPRTHDERARSQRPAVSTSPEPAEEAGADDAATGEETSDAGADGESGPVTEGSRASGTAE